MLYPELSVDWCNSHYLNRTRELIICPRVPFHCDSDWFTSNFNRVNALARQKQYCDLYAHQTRNLHVLCKKHFLVTNNDNSQFIVIVAEKHIPYSNIWMHFKSRYFFDVFHHFHSKLK